MKPVTLFILPNEKAWALREINLVRPPTHQWRRYQIVTVVRADVLSEWWRDMGPTVPRPEIEIPSLGEHTVAELQGIAEQYQDDHWGKFVAEKQAESTLIPDFLDQYAERSLIIKNKSKFGPGYSKQRNGFRSAV